MDRKIISDQGKAIDTKSEVKEKKSFLRQLCEKLTPCPTDSKKKSLKEIIENYKKLSEQKVDNEHSNRMKELNNLSIKYTQYIQNRTHTIYTLYMPFKNIANLKYISDSINRIDHEIIKKFSRYHVMLYHEDKSIRDAFSNFAKSGIEKDIAKRKDLMKEYELRKLKALKI